MATEYPLKLTIRAIDKATAPLRALNERMKAFTAPMRKLNNSFRALSAEAGFPRLVKGFSGVGRAVSGVGQEAFSLGVKLAAMASAAAFGFYRIVSGAVDAGDKLGEMAGRVGLSVDAYSQLQYAAAQADVEQEQFNASLDQLNRRLGEAKAGGGPLLSFLNQVAPALGQQMKGAKGTGEALKLLAGAFEKVTDPAKRAALTAAAFGKGGVQMGQFLGQGTAAIEAQGAEFARLAGSQEKFAEDAGKLDNATRRTKVAFGALGNAALAKLFPALTKLADAVSALVVKHGDKAVAFFEKVGAALSAWVDDDGVGKLAKQIGELVDRVEAAVKWMGGWKVAGGLVLAVMAGPLLGSVLGLAAAVVTLGTAIGFTPIGWFLLGITAIAGAAYLLISNWSNIGKFFTDLFEGVKEVFSGFSDTVYSILVGDVEKAWDGLKRIFKGGVKFVATLLDGLVAIVKPVAAALGAVGIDMPEIPSFRAMLGPDAMGPAVGAAAAAPVPLMAAMNQETRVFVDFSNLPRGTRVMKDAGGTAPLDLSMGYSMVAQ